MSNRTERPCKIFQIVLTMHFLYRQVITVQNDAEQQRGTRFVFKKALLMKLIVHEPEAADPFKVFHMFFARMLHREKYGDSLIGSPAFSCCFYHNILWTFFDKRTFLCTFPLRSEYAMGESK